MNDNTQLQWRKKPIVIEAFQMTAERREDNADWPNWLHDAWQLEREFPGSLYPTTRGVTADRTVSIGTLEGPLLVSPGDWIIRGVKGEIYPCKPDIFAASYEQASTTQVVAWIRWKDDPDGGPYLALDKDCDLWSVGRREDGLPIEKPLILKPDAPKATAQ